MNDQTENPGTGSDLESLQALAAELGIKHHPAMGAVKLQKLIDARQIVTPEPQPVRPPVTEQLTVSEITELQQLRAEKAEREANKVVVPIESESQMRARIIRDAGRLVRVHVSNMNQNKREWVGEMYTISNDYVTFKRFVPFNNEEGWHVEQMIYDFMKSKQCQVFYTKIDNRGNKTKHGKLINELSIQKMPPLTEDELLALAQRQAMAKGSEAA